MVSSRESDWPCTGCHPEGPEPRQARIVAQLVPTLALVTDPWRPTCESVAETCAGSSPV